MRKKIKEILENNNAENILFALELLHKDNKEEAKEVLLELWHSNCGWEVWSNSAAVFIKRYGTFIDYFPPYGISYINLGTPGQYMIYE